MFKVVKNNNQKVLTRGNVNYLLVEKWSNTLESILYDCEAVIITTKDVAWFNDIVLQLRTHNDKNIFLKPLFYKYDINADHKVHTDGLFEENLSEVSVRNIVERIESVSQITSCGAFDISMRLTQFLFTREAKLIPVKHRYSKIGYNYPFMGLYFLNKECDIEKQLQNLVNDDVLNVQLKDKVQLCNDCRDSYLVYKETCPKCKSIDISAHDIIHHFTCAHVAPQEEFMNKDDDQLQCPKCDKHLRHIGIDYDKPSSVYNCGTCDHHFQVSEVLAECHSCNHVNGLEELIEVTIYDYELTMKGILMAEGKYKISRAEVQNTQTVFNQLLEQEKQRNFAEGRSSFVAQITLTGELLKIIDSNYMNTFWKDVRQISIGYITNDLCFARTDNTLKLLLLDMDAKSVNAIYEKLIYNMQLLLSDNIRSHIAIEHQLTDIQQL